MSCAKVPVHNYNQNKYKALGSITGTFFEVRNFFHKFNKT